MNSLMGTNPSPAVLIVEDDESVALLERRTLERHGFQVRTASTGKDALAAIQSGSVDLIIMDYRLPDTISGLELLSTMRELGHEQPVIMVTGHSDEMTAINALRQGVRDFVPKTMHYLDYLPAAVDRILKVVGTEKRLSESEARFQSFMDNSPAIAFIKNREGRLLYANRRFSEECSRSDCVGKTDEELWPTATAQQLRQSDLVALKAQFPRQVVETLAKNDGTVRHWLTCRFPLSDGEGGELIGGMAVDVTGQKEAEESLKRSDDQLRQAQKMEAIGQLAGGIAHDFNNLLTIILGYSRILSDADEEVSGKHRLDMLTEIQKAAESAAQLTRQLLAFSRKQILKPQVLNLNGVVGELQKMLRRLIGEDISIHMTLAPDLQPVSADPGQIEQVIMNLAVNARDAMPLGGELCIKTQNIELSQAYAQTHPEVKPGPYVMLAISDSGCGMDEATKSRIFEPFFTTKEVGKGTGLGLATVYGIVRQSNGHIQVYSEPGHGTSFKIYLPAEASLAVHRGSEAGDKGALRGVETVLLVEDEDGVRALSKSILELYGYTVLEADSPAQAIEVCHTYGGRIDVLVTDLVMPQMNGTRLAELLHSERPALKTLFMSGYTDDAIVRQGILNADVSFLQKPFSPDGLATKVRSVLEANS